MTLTALTGALAGEGNGGRQVSLRFDIRTGEHWSSMAREGIRLLGAQRGPPRLEVPSSHSTRSLVGCGGRIAAPKGPIRGIPFREINQHSAVLRISPRWRTRVLGDSLDDAQPAPTSRRRPVHRDLATPPPSSEMTRQRGGCGCLGRDHGETSCIAPAPVSELPGSLVRGRPTATGPREP